MSSCKIGRPSKVIPLNLMTFKPLQLDAILCHKYLVITVTYFSGMRVVLQLIIQLALFATLSFNGAAHHNKHSCQMTSSSPRCFSPVTEYKALLRRHIRGGDSSTTFEENLRWSSFACWPSWLAASVCSG